MTIALVEGVQPSAQATVTSQMIEAGRHICLEARIVLRSLRNGPPHVARGDLAQDIMDLRSSLERILSSVTPSAPVVETESRSWETALHVVTNPYVRPFLRVITDPRASGPHTLAALRSIYRLLGSSSLQVFQVSLLELTTNILGCKFEQTDPSFDEAVELAIADVLCQLVVYSARESSSLSQTPLSYLPATVLLDAFNTVFVTRHTFLHTSMALAYHLEDVLTKMIVAVFTTKDQASAKAALMEFLVNQLLHTPLVGGTNDTMLDESTREARKSHDDTRTLCLRLIRRALQEWNLQDEDHTTGPPAENAPYGAAPSRTLWSIIQDDLCLSLLMTGQAIWAGSSLDGASAAMSPGFVSLEVLSEICAVLALLWNTLDLRQVLVAQFETIWTGFYTRALVLLRKRPQPIHSAALFHANGLFDAEVEIILESLVDLLCLHDHSSTVADGDGGTIETLFSSYDCHLRRSDVAASLLVELARCCGGTVVNTEGQFAGSAFTPPRHDGVSNGLENLQGDIKPNIGGPDNGDDQDDIVEVNYPVRPVPAHLKELCAQALTGGMKCLFRDDHASAETVRERLQRKRSIMVQQLRAGTLIPCDDEIHEEMDHGSHVLRDLKSKKRLMAKAARIFNKKASRGIEFLVDAGLVPDPITPASMASFLRNGIVVGLDKRAVGAYLGEAGKAPIAGKSPPTWERDWFHKDVLRIYCSLFRFEDQSLLEGLRMFLATFRLPGEAQQIDRILQAFSDTCSQVCEESKLGIFSSDPKRASDAAYLLSFSIIMLNTDRHNKNIREDRKMSCEDFYKNNFDYGRDITEKGKEFPREYLASIYDSINEEEIRTEGEGADGAMTVERWKDVLRGFTDDELDVLPTHSDADDLTELVLEHVWRPVVSAIGALWNVHVSRSQYLEAPTKPAEGNLLGVQGARLGMDMATEMLNGVCQLGRLDIFRRLLMCICDYTGLLGDYTDDAATRAWSFSNSLESQAATIVAMRTAIESGENLDEECWKRIWSILFELRDLKVIGRRSESHKGLFHESEPDLLTEIARMEWTMCLQKGDMDYCSRSQPNKPRDAGSGILGAFGRALFGQANAARESRIEDEYILDRSNHEKETLFVWDEGALSDFEDDVDTSDTVVSTLSEFRSSTTAGDTPTPGMLFEELLVRENLEINRQIDLPVTGLERMDEARQLGVSARARARRRLHQSCDLRLIVSESRFMDEIAIVNVLQSLVHLVSSVEAPSLFVVELAPVSAKSLDRCSSDLSFSSGSAGLAPLQVPISPASEAFAEVLICELTVKNRDRLKLLWTDVLQDHYLSCLTRLLINPDEGPNTTGKVPVDPGLEKRVTGLLRISMCAIKRTDIANEVLSSWKYVLPINDEQHAASPLRFLYRHIGEGLWRIVVDVDSLSANLNEDGWEGILSLIGWCAKRGSVMKPVPVANGDKSTGIVGLSEDDPSLQAYRALHLLLSTKELDAIIPCSVLWSLRCLVATGGRRHYAQLSIASLDLLDILHEKKVHAFAKTSTSPESSVQFWTSCWKSIIEGIAEAAELSVDTVRVYAGLYSAFIFLIVADSYFITVSLLCTEYTPTCTFHPD
jgi:Sec7 domain